MRVNGRGVLALLLLPFLSTYACAEDWVVSKATGQVWHAPAQAQPVSLGADTRLAPGDLVQTGPTGRVMLTRGSERILVAPNSVISLPKAQDKPGFTTILQQAGAIAIEAEKKDHKHFEVLTPYLAAVVKGTQFTVTVGKGIADVSVASGKVEVADVKSGKIALVLPGQFAKVGATSGLSLGGSGTFEPILQGAPRASTPNAVTVPRQGFTTAPKVDAGLRVDNTPAGTKAAANVVRIEKALGPIALDAGKATAGLIRSEGPGANRGTIWKPASNDTASSSTSAKSSGNGSGASASPTGVAASSGVASSAPGASGAGVGAGIGASVVAGTPAASVAAAGNGLGTGLGNGNGNGNGNAFGLNGGNGVGKAFGLSKKQ
jgi:hypothetical protein